MKPRSDLKRANMQAKILRRTFPHAVSAYYKPQAGQIIIELSSKVTVCFFPEDVQGLQNAKPAQLNRIEITPSGFGLHFPEFDADIYVPGLLQGFLGSTKWMAARLGRIGGQSKSVAKRAASRANGKLGGRPGRTAS